MSEDLRGIAPRWGVEAGLDAAEPELEAFAALRSAGVPTSPVLLVPAGAEEAFYRLNGLPPRLETLLAPLATTDPDEDDVEELAPEAQRTVAGHALLDAWVDAFLDALDGGPDLVTVRRAEAAGAVAAPSGAETAARGRAALLALRRLWAAEWDVEAVLVRCRRTGSALPRPRAALLHAPGDAEADADLAARIRPIAPGARAQVDALGRVARLYWAASAERPAPTSPPG